MVPRTRSTPVSETEPGPSRITEESSSTQTEAPPPTSRTQLDINLAATQDTIQKLQRYKDLQEQLATLESEIALRHPNASFQTTRRNPHEFYDQDQEIKFKNIPTYTLNYSLQKRQEWLLDLQQMFEGAPKRYHDGRTQILGALNHMDTTCRQRWYRHIDEKATDSQRGLKEDWLYFKEWTLTLIKNAASLETEVMGQLERAFQHREEDPREFHARLDTLEQHFPRLAEKERALAYFAKLRYDLQNTIRRHVIKLPETREEMIDVAYHFWDLDLTESTRKRKRPERSPDPSRKRTATETSPPESSRARKRSPQNPRGGYRKPRKDQGSTSKPRLNPVGENGKRNQCFNCGSEEHYSNKCPKPQNNQPATIQSARQGNDSETE